MTINLPEPLASRLAAEAARQGIDPTQLAVEALQAVYGPAAPHQDDEEQDQRRREALKAFIGCGSSGDPEWASRPTRELRAEAATRKLARGI